VNKISTTILACLLACSAFAEENKPLESELELGIITTGGNTKTQSYKGKFDLKQDFTAWQTHFVLEGLLKRDEVEQSLANGETTKEEQTTAEKYFTSAKGDYKINQNHASLLVYGEYDRNRFSGFDYQYTLAFGYSNRLFTTDNSYLAYDIGPGFTVDQPEDINGEEQDKVESPVVRVAAEYVLEFNDNAKFTQTLSSNINPDSEENTKTKSVTAVTAQINSSLALRASYTVDYNSEVPEERKHADTETAMTVVYRF